MTRASPGTQRASGDVLRSVTRVVNFSTGAGIAGIDVSLSRIGGTGTPVSRTTNATGQYNFTGVAPDSYQVGLSSPPPDTFSLDSRPSADTVEVVAGQTATARNFELRLLVGAIQGTVTDNAANALAGRTVRLLKGGVGTGRSEVSDGTGGYTFSNVTVGTYGVTATLNCGEPSATTPAVTVTDGATATPAAIEVTPRPSELLLTCDIQPIFTASCALSGCHAGQFPAQQLNLSSPASVKSTAINVGSNERPGVLRIRPLDDDTAASYLVCKIVEVCPGRVLARMPLTGPPYLSAVVIDSIRTWIRQGALDVN